MIWLIQNWKLVASGVVMILLFASGYTTGASSVQSQWDSEKLSEQAESTRIAEEQSKKITDLEVAKNENTTRIDGLLANNHALWLRLQKTTCPPVTDTGGGLQPTPGDGALYPDPSTIIEGYSREVERQFGQCDKIVETARVNAEYLKSLKAR